MVQKLQFRHIFFLIVLISLYNIGMYQNINITYVPYITIKLNDQTTQEEKKGVTNRLTHLLQQKIKYTIMNELISQEAKLGWRRVT